METKEFVKDQNVIIMPFLARSLVREKFHLRQVHSSLTKGKSSCKTSSRDGPLKSTETTINEQKQAN